MQRDVVVIGGGLSGLAAAYTLEQHGLSYTLIEVKRHLGGSIRSVAQDGFVMDAGPLVIADTLDAGWLSRLGLAEALATVPGGRIFKRGSGALIEALAEKLTAPRMMRMAVSSIGETDNGRFAICLENGLVLDARSLIIALPARYAERLFYGYITAITQALLDYQYDTILRVSLGVPTDHLPERLRTSMAYTTIHRITHPERVPQGHTLLQIGLRLDPARQDPALEAVVDHLCEALHLPAPVSQRTDYWPEADPISCYDDDHAEWVQAVRAQLPAGVALIGSDYSLTAPWRRGIADLHPRIAQGIAAADAMRDFLAG